MKSSLHEILKLTLSNRMARRLNQNISENKIHSKPVINTSRTFSFLHSRVRSTQAHIRTRNRMKSPWTWATFSTFFSYYNNNHISLYFRLFAFLRLSTCRHSACIISKQKKIKIIRLWCYFHHHRHGITIYDYNVCLFK